MAPTSAFSRYQAHRSPGADMRKQITSGHTRRAAAACRDLTPSRTASRAANSCRSISPRRDAMHLPARALGPLPHVLKPPHVAHGQLRQRRREILGGRQLRHALTAETPEHLGDLRRTHHRKLHTAQFRRLPTRRLPTRPLPTDLGTPGPRWLVASASSGPPSNAGRSFTPQQMDWTTELDTLPGPTRWPRSAGARRSDLRLLGYGASAYRNRDAAGPCAARGPRARRRQARHGYDIDVPADQVRGEGVDIADRAIWTVTLVELQAATNKLVAAPTSTPPATPHPEPACSGSRPQWPPSVPRTRSSPPG